MELSEVVYAVQQRRESRRALSPKAAAARWSRDSEQDYTVENGLGSTLRRHTSRLEHDRRAMS
jgi:hypothetical protein